jgi:adenine-specific DNA-methyltransferase
MEQIEKVDLKSLQITEDIKAQLKAIMPQVFSEGKIDFEKLKLTLGEEISDSEERFGLQWPGKKDCFKVIQEPSIGTLKPCKEESVNWDTTENLFIEGDNLEVLKQLQKAYYAEIKMIYIDPPYNTGNDFVYKDSFGDNIKNYQNQTGQLNEDGNTMSTNNETDGRFHSNWLNMMYPRLFLARNLLKSDGVIFISIDDNEVHNLKAICNEIFGEENFLAQIIWQRAFSPVNLKKTFSPNHDFILCYSKNINHVNIKGLTRDDTSINRYKNPDNDPRGPWTSGDLSVGPIIQEKIYEIITPSGRKVLPPSGYCWRVSIDKFESLKKENKIWFGEKGDNVPRLKRFLSDVSDKITPMTIWTRDEVGDSQSASRHLKQIFDGATYFDYPKPVKLIERFLDLVIDKDDIVLDFFLGSGTTGEAVFNFNNTNNANVKFIGVQLPEKTHQNSTAFKDGFKFLSDITLERLRKNILNKDEGIRKYKLSESNFDLWNGNTEFDNLSIMLEKAVTNINLDSSDINVLTEIIIKSGFKITVPIEEFTLAKKKVFSISDGSMIICLDKDLNEDIIKEMAKLEPARVVCLDSGFNNRDELKTNAAQIMKSFGIDDFRTI